MLLRTLRGLISFKNVRQRERGEMDGGDYRNVRPQLNATPPCLYGGGESSVLVF